MTGLLPWFVDETEFLPHGYCLAWQPDLMWATIGADVVVALSYFSIPVALTVFAIRRKDLAFPWVFYLFGAFVLLCGGTHVLEAVTFWWPLYRIEAAAKVMTAGVSLATALALWPLMPRALALPGIGQLRALNDDLGREIARRRKVELALRDLNVDLEQRVAERTRALEAEIAERRRIEAGLRDTSGLLKAVFDAVPFPIVVVAPDTTILMWSGATEQVFGYDASDMLGRRYGDVITPSDDAGFNEPFARALAGEHVRHTQIRRHHRSGRMVDISVSGGPVPDESGAARAVVCVLEDVTQRNIVEAQLRQAQKMEAIGSLTGGLAHDFNNLLAVILGNLESIEGDLAGDPGNAELVADALDAAERGAELTRHLLAFARRQPLQPAVVDVNAQVERSMALLRRTLGEQIVFAFELDPAVWPVVVDAAQLESALTNLATNARDAMPRGGRLLVQTTNVKIDQTYVELNPEVAVGQYAMIALSDTGDGIPPELLPRIFEPFFTTKVEGRGTGLGLAMVFGFIKQSGGHIAVYSELGKGSCFRIYLPRAPGGERVVAPATEEPRPEAGVETVLVVEDNEALRRVVVRQIAGLGYRVLEAESAAAALVVLAGPDPVDLLFTDIVMAGEMNGTDLARAALARDKSLKVLFTSGFPDARGDAAGWGNGEAALLVKPYRREDLARALRRALDG